MLWNQPYLSADPASGIGWLWPQRLLTLLLLSSYLSNAMGSSVCHKIAVRVIFVAFIKHLQNAFRVSLSVAKELQLAFCSPPFACSSVTLHLSGHGSIFPLFLWRCFHAITVTVSRLQTPVVLLWQVLLATGVGIGPFPPLLFLPVGCSFSFRGACTRPAQSRAANWGGMGGSSICPDQYMP